MGEVTVDWLAAERGQTLLQSGNFYRSLGGNASNVAIGLSRLGTPVRLVGKVGNDPHGEYLADVLAREGVDLTFLARDSSYPTAQCYVLTRLDGEHTFYNWPRPNAAQMLGPEDVPEEVFEHAGFLHATGISFTLEPRRSALEQAIDLALQRGMIVSFDAGFPSGEDLEARSSLEAILSRVHILKVNHPELLFWSGGDRGDSMESMARRLFDRYQPSILTVTLGSQGSLIVGPDQAIACAPLPVESTGGVGAGDGFIAGLLHTLHRRLGESPDTSQLSKLAPVDWMEIGRFANAVGALVTRCIGAWEGLPRLSEVELLQGRRQDEAWGKPQ